MMLAKIKNILNHTSLKYHNSIQGSIGRKKEVIREDFKINFEYRIYLLFLQPNHLNTGERLSDGVIGNTSGFGPEEFRFET
jgi:hypothetical protein